MREMEERSWQTRLQWMTGGIYSVQSLVLVLYEEFLLFSLCSLHPRELQLEDTSALSSCNKKQNWAVLFWGFLGFGLLRGFFASASSPGNSALCHLRSHSQAHLAYSWEDTGIQETTRMSSVSLAPSPLQGCIFSLRAAYCHLPPCHKFLWKAGATDENQGISVLCKGSSFEKPGSLHVLEGE